MKAVFLFSAAVQCLKILPSVQAFVTPSHAQKVITSPPFHQRQQSCALSMSYWSPAEVKSTEVANQSGNRISLTVSVPPEVARGYRQSGQFVQLHWNESIVSLANSNPPDPDNPVFEFLVEKVPDNEWITGTTSGTEVEVSTQVMGRGFHPIVENVAAQNKFPMDYVLFFATGRGIAPIKAAIESGQLSGRKARLYYGVRTPDDLCFTSRYPEWETLGVEVVPVVSQPPQSWDGRTGYVQDCLEEDGVDNPQQSGALLCGQDTMIQSVQEILIKNGVFEGRIMTNL